MFSLPRKLLPLVLCLLLAGCAGSGQQAVPEAAASETVHFLKESTASGSFRFFDAECTDCGLHSMGDCILLLFAQEDGTRLQKLNGNRILAETTVPVPMLWKNSSLQVRENGISFFDTDSHAVILLDGDLEQTRSIAMPEELQGQPLLTDDCATAYYCTSKAVHALDCRSGQTRILREMKPCSMTVSSLLLEDSVIGCTVYPDDGSEQYLYLSAGNGAVLKNTRERTPLITSGRDFFAYAAYGQNHGLLYGNAREEPQMLILPQGFALIGYLPDRFAAIVCSNQSGKNQLRAYDLRSGTILAEAETDGCNAFRGAVSAPDGSVWLAAASDAGAMLCRWDMNADTQNNSICYATPYYSAAVPDKAGLAQCRAIAERLSQTYGITIQICEDAAALHPWDYSFTPEYLVPVLKEELALMEQRLKQFPEGFLQTMAQNAEETRLCIVRSIEGTEGSASLDSASGLQFWEGGISSIVIAAGTGSERALYHELCHMIDTQILTRSDIYDTWEQLNPSEFSYTFSYDISLVPDGSRYLTDGQRSFVDLYSMTYPKEDRARILECAMTAGNEELFSSPILQRKLQRICIGIRESFGLTKYTSPLPWEQYLNR